MSDYPLPSENIFLVKELEGNDGEPPRTIAFSDVDIKPLDFEQLVQARLHENITIPLEMFNGKVIDTNIEGVDKSKYAHVRTVLESPFTSTVIGLVRGGWLPSALGAYRGRTVSLIDRNVVTEIVSRFEGGEKKGREPDFLDMFSDQKVRINPLLYAMEGNAREIPGPELAKAQLNEVIAKLKAALPKADLQIGPESLKGIVGLIEDTRTSMGQRQAFLLRLAPSLKAPIARKHLEQRWDEVLDAADACGVPPNSLVVLAALSCVAVPGGASPAKALLKFKDGYDAGDAYNALADLRSLEVLVHIFTIFPDEDVQLCTADKNLALFWTGIRASNFTRSGPRVSFDLDPVEQILPSHMQDKWRLAMV
ncbi:MAG: hypothetical protein ACP5DX_15055 [Paracoccaceae bacterium]